MMYESFVPKKEDMDGNQVRLLSCGFLPTSSPCAGVFPGFPGRFCPPPGFLCLLVLLLRIRGFLYLNLWEFSAASACVIFDVFLSFLRPPQDKMHRQLSLTVGVCTPCQKSKLQQYNRFFFRVVMTPSLLPEGQAFIRRMWDFSECVIVIVIVIVKSAPDAAHDNADTLPSVEHEVYEA